MEIRACIYVKVKQWKLHKLEDSQVNNCSMCPLWTFQILVTTDQLLCWSVVDRDWPSRYALCLWDSPNPRSKLCTHFAAKHPRQHNRWGLCPDCSAARQKARWSWIRSVFPIVFPVELGRFHLFYPITNCGKIFARNLSQFYVTQNWLYFNLRYSF